MLAASHKPAFLNKAVLTLCAMIVAGLATTSIASSVTPEAIKAAYIYNFMRFTFWPPGAESEKSETINMLFVGETPIAAIIREAATDAEVHLGRPLSVDTVDQLSIDQELLPYRLIYFTSFGQSDRNILAQAPQRHPILTMSAVPGFARHGGMVEFQKTEAGNMGWIINLPLIKHHQLMLSAQILRNAIEVYDQISPTGIPHDE